MRTLLTALLLVLAVPAGTAYGGKLPDWARSLAEVDCSHHDTNEVDAVCLLDETELTIDPSGTLVHRTRRAFRILTTAGNGRGTAVISHNSRSKINGARAWVQYPNGKVERIREGDTLDTQYADSTFFTDARRRVIPLPGVTKGAVVFFEWELEQDEEFMLVHWRFQSTDPVLESTLSFDLPAGVDLAWQAVNMDEGWKPRVSGSRHLFQRKDVPAVPDEEWAPPAADLMEGVLIRFHSPAGGTPPCEDWADVARWYHGLTREKWAVDDGTRSLSAEICNGAADAEEKIRRLCRWVQSKIRYVDIEIGMGGYIPHDPAEVCRTKYGDCKDKAFLLMGLLRAQGIEAWPVLCRLGGRAGIEAGFPWPGAFNHCITALAAPGAGIRFFDPTSELVPYPCLSPKLEGAMGLLVRADGGELLPMASGVEPRLDVHVEAEITASGGMKARVKEVYSLAALRGVRERFGSLSEEQRHSDWEAWLSRRIPGIKLEEVTWRNLYDAEKDLVIEYSLSAPGLVKRMGSLIMVSPFFIADVNKPSFGKAERKLPVSLEETAIVARQEVVLRYPAGLAVEENIEPCRVATDFGEFSVTVSEGEGELTLVKEYVVRHAIVPAARYGEVKSFFAEVNNAERTEILFASGE